jgi:hypothetical protein
MIMAILISLSGSELAALPIANAVTKVRVNSNGSSMQNAVESSGVTDNEHLVYIATNMLQTL